MVAIRVESLRFTYRNGVEALRGVTFAIGTGERVALLGPNGSGKTTLLRCLNGLLRPSEGYVEVMGRRVERRNLDWVRERLQLVFQNPDDQLFAPTVEEDVAFGPRNLGLGEEEVGRRVRDALERFNLLELRRRSPAELSQGQKRLVAIAGVVSMEPRIVALDEPTADLDERSSRAILEALDALHRAGATILLATHDVELACLWAERVILLVEGSVVADGTPADVFYDAKELEDMGVRVPRVVSICRQLSRLGLVDSTARPLSIQELLSVLKVLQRPS
jgi:cobalt/nickel transport system ATP-binding protein